jgi:hypothetical protein
VIALPIGWPPSRSQATTVSRCEVIPQLAIALTGQPACASATSTAHARGNRRWILLDPSGLWVDAPNRLVAVAGDAPFAV